MKRYLLAFAGALGLAASLGTASAADLSRPAPYATKAPPYVAPYYNWTGFYIGVNGGGAFGTSNSFDTSGGLVGGQLGYNWQVGQFVYGLEGDADWTNIRSNNNGVGCGFVGCTVRNDFLSTVRGRLGYAADRFMPYVTGGLAIGDIRTAGPLIGNDQTNAGWTVGGGLEFALPSNWTAKVEYLYVDLGNNCGAGCGIANNGDFTTNIIRGGFNYRF